VDDHIKIQQGIKHENAVLMVTSMLGQTYKIPVYPYGTVDLSHLAPACYQLTLIDGNQHYKTRIIKR